MNIIGINGFKRSGKGEVAAAVTRLMNRDGYLVKSVGFADKLKILAARTLGFGDLSNAECIALMDEAKERSGVIFGASRPLFRKLPDGSWDEDPLPFEHRITGRQYLQNLGNEARSVFGDSFWVDQVLPGHTDRTGVWSKTLEAKYPGIDVLCVTDVRYPNEAQRIRDYGGVVWEVMRPGVESDGHASEQPLPRELIDWQIHNDDGLDKLEQLVNEAIQETI